MDDNIASLCFSNSIGVGPKSFQKLVKIYGSAANAYQNFSKEVYKQAGIGDKNFIKFADFKKIHLTIWFTKIC